MGVLTCKFQPFTCFKILVRTSVGKNALAKKLVDYMFNNNRTNISIQLSLNEYNVENYVQFPK
jgi:ATP-dependent Clp protease ATP-binding subunit ClpA